MVSEFLKIKLQNFDLAYNSLLKSLRREWQYDDGLRDSVIQRFEFTVETCWKFYKEYFDYLELNLQSPKAVFREMLKFHILTEEEVVTALKMLESRNLTSHTYKEELAIEVAEKVVGYIPILEKLLLSASRLD